MCVCVRGTYITTYAVALKLWWSFSEVIALWALFVSIGVMFGMHQLVVMSAYTAIPTDSC